MNGSRQTSAPASGRQEIRVRRADERGYGDHGWLRTSHTFSFAQYFDPAWMGFGHLRVLNEDRVLPGHGFPTHSHRDMEILSVVLEGELSHRDSLGNGSVIRPGEFQLMSAGTGIRHSESNSSADRLLHFLQIWILPERSGIAPGYQQKSFPEAERHGSLRLIASRDGRQGSLLIHQDASVYSAVLRPGDAIADRLPEHRRAWLQVARGVLALNNELLGPGDGAAILGGGPIELKAPVEGAPAELLLLDLA